jgi:hypothetical protein
MVALGKRVLFVGRHAGRRPAHGRWAVATLVVVGVFVASILWTCSRPYEDTLLLAMPVGMALILFIVFAAIAVATYWAWWTGHMDRLEVSTDGITYGEETWTWSQIQAVRVTTLANRRINCLRLWTRHRRGIGRVLTFDDALTQADLVRLASRLRPYCQDCDIDNIHR